MSKIDDSKIDAKTKQQLEDFINSGKADIISKNIENIDKDKILRMFSSLSKEDIKKGLSGGVKNIDAGNLKQFMKEKK